MFAISPGGRKVVVVRDLSLGSMSVYFSITLFMNCCTIQDPVQDLTVVPSLLMMLLHGMVSLMGGRCVAVLGDRHVGLSSRS